jgi:hypothetical protein
MANQKIKKLIELIIFYPSKKLINYILKGVFIRLVKQMLHPEKLPLMYGVTKHEFVWILSTSKRKLLSQTCSIARFNLLLTSSAKE